MQNLKLSLAYLLIILPAIIWGQANPYFFSYQIDSILNVDSTFYKFQTASCNYSFIGEYKTAIEIRDRQYPKAKAWSASQEHKDIFKKYTPIDAREAILKEARKARIIIINEGHHIGLHRVFLTTLLVDLHKLGYSFIGMEALDYEDTLLNKREYPILKSGFYTQEPCFGNLIREARIAGFTLFPYEQIYEDSTQKAMGREKAQALNIKKIMDLNPEAKFVIYCGYDHAKEDTLSNFGLPMAGQLKRITGIDPFTIDQTALTEYYIVSGKGGRYRELMNQSFDALYVDSSLHYFNKASIPNSVDCNIYHPTTQYVMNRPNWLLRNGTRLVLLQDKIKIDYPYLIKIYQKTDDIDTAVPIDVIEIKSKESKVASLVFTNKKQIAVAINNKGDKQVIELK